MKAPMFHPRKKLSVCARWLHNCKPVEHFLSIMPAKETTAEAIASYLCTFLEAKTIDITKMRGVGLMVLTQCRAKEVVFN